MNASCRYLDALVPESDRTDGALRARTVANARRRLDAAMRRWARLAAADGDDRRPVEVARRRLAAARAVAAPMLTAIGRGDSSGWLARGEARCWISAVEGYLEVAAVAARCSAIDRSRRRAARCWGDLIADEGLLARLAPGGSVPLRLPEAALADAACALERLASEAHRIGLAFAGREALVALGRSFLRFEDDLDAGRRGETATLSGASWRLAAPRGRPAGVHLELKEDAIVFRGEALPYPTSTDAARTGPEVGALLVCRGLEIRVGHVQPAFERRVGRALALLEDAWPAGARLVRDRTWRIVPVAEWATVSYSSPLKPGVAYIHVDSRPAVRLAEDLVHEAAHMRLHEIEAAHDLLHPDALAEEGPRFYSPWRREWRPLRGLLHACTTFTIGAEFFERMLAASQKPSARVRFPRARRLWLARRLLEEIAMVTVGLDALRSAERQGFLRADGRRFVRSIGTGLARTRRAAARRERALRASVAGRAELARVARLDARLRRHPVRWSWEPNEADR